MNVTTRFHLDTRTRIQAILSTCLPNRLSKTKEKKVDAINPQLSERRRRGPSSLVKFCYILSKNKKVNWQKFLSCSTFSPFCIYLNFPTLPPMGTLNKKVAI